jgi:hypothetical protein
MFWVLALAGVGLGGVVTSLLAPGRPLLAVGVGAVVGAVLAVSVARKMLKHGPGAMQMLRGPKVPLGDRPRVLFVCGSQNQTGQMLQIAKALPEVEAWFTPYYSDDPITTGLVKGHILE